MRIFVTGGTGFVGGHFLRAAIAAGHDVVALRRPHSVPRLAFQVEPRWVLGTDDDLRRQDFHGFDALVHAAAVGVSPRKATWSEYFRVNVSLAIELAERAHEHGVRRIVATGTFVEYGTAANRYRPIPASAPLEPLGPYALSKACQFWGLSGMCADRGFELVYARLFSVFGEGQFEDNLWPSLHRAALAGEDVPMTAGGQIRDFVEVEQVARSLTGALEWPAERGKPLVRNIGSGNPRTVREFAEHWWREWRAPGKLLFGQLQQRPGEIMAYVPEL